MRKIRLDIESLAVDSFVADEKRESEGTVHGNQINPSFMESCNDAVTCARRRSDYYSCVADCECTNARVRCLQEF